MPVTAGHSFDAAGETGAIIFQCKIFRMRLGKAGGEAEKCQPVTGGDQHGASPQIHQFLRCNFPAESVVDIIGEIAVNPVGTLVNINRGQFPFRPIWCNRSDVAGKIKTDSRKTFEKLESGVDGSMFRGKSAAGSFRFSHRIVPSRDDYIFSLCSDDEAVSVRDIGIHRSEQESRNFPCRSFQHGNLFSEDPSELFCGDTGGILCRRRLAGHDFKTGFSVFDQCHNRFRPDFFNSGFLRFQRVAGK